MSVHMRGLVGLVSLLGFVLGCGKADFYQCEGVATHDGKPVPFLQVDFLPVDPNLGRPPFAMTDENGRFQLTTGREYGLVPGSYKVSVQDPGAADGRKTSTEPAYLYVIDRYSDQKSDITYEADRHNKNFELKLDTKEYTGPAVRKNTEFKSI